MAYYSILNRIEMDIAAQVLKVTLLLNENGLVAPLKNCAAMAVSFVVGFSVTIKYSLRQQAG
jgi:hypothetical protein